MKKRKAELPDDGGKKRGRRSRREQETGKLGPAMTREIAERLRLGIERFFRRNAGLSLRQAYFQTLATYFAAGFEMRNGVRVPLLKPAHELPSFGQFLYLHRKLARIKID